jgi:DNA polymerase III subunit epsilon
MKPAHYLVVGTGLAAGFLLAVVGVAAGLVWSDLTAPERMAVGEALSGRVILVVMVLLGGCALVFGLLRGLIERHITLPARLAEEAVTLLSSTDTAKRLRPDGPPPVQALALAFNSLAEQRQRLSEDMNERVRQARQSVEEEKNRLAALMSELRQAVVVCNMDGRILLYNQRARLESRAFSEAPRVAGGGELMGLGRSIYAVFDRNLIAHALETIQDRLGREGQDPVAHFVTTTRAGQLLRIQMAPVLSSSAGTQETQGGREITGFILMLENITQTFEAETRRDQMLNSLTEGNRAAMANVRAAAEMLDYADLPDEMRDRFRCVIRDEIQAMSRRLEDVASEFALSLKSRWSLEEIHGADLVAALRRRVEGLLKLPTKEESVDETVWVKVDSFSLMQAVSYLASRLQDEFEVRELRFRLGWTGERVHLDMIWSGQAMSTETVMNWELEPMRIGNENSPLTVRDVIERHDGEIWLEREKVRHRAFFRILLPLAMPHEAEAHTAMKIESRPEYYDFDLFNWAEKSQALEDRPLAELVFTVFDTETTGLNPSQGDEIIQIGATRILKGKLLKSESFEQLVDPKRPLPPESVLIHGIEPDMLKGQPEITVVLPAFHAFAADTVLVAHNAAFDMRFLQLKEAKTGLVFDQPVLDTLLLSAVIHPNQASHRLEAIAERFGINIIGRHTALGDAIVTAEVFLRMIPLLAEKGIHTLGEARRAAEKTYYARLKY